MEGLGKVREGLSLRHPLVAPVTLLSQGQTARPLALSADGSGALTELTEALEDSVLLMVGRSVPREGTVISFNSPLETLLPKLQEVPL